MATESPIRIVEGTERWRNLKQSTRYESPSSRIAIDSLGLFLKDQRYQSFKEDVIPSRSGSAPPNMEGSVAAIENMFSLRKSVLNHGSIGPSIAAITDPNVDQRFGGPLSSLESHLAIQPSVSSGNSKIARHKCADGSLELPRNSLPVHEEESEDDQSSEQSGYASVEKAALLGYNSRSLDSMQGDSYQSSSPSHHSLSYKSTEETFVTGSGSGILHNMFVSTSSADTNNPCLDDKRQIPPLDGNMDIVVGESLHEKVLNAAEVETPDNVSITGAVNIETTNVEAVKSVNVYSASSNSETQNFHEKEHHMRHNTVLHQQVAPQEWGTSRVQGYYSQIVYPGMSHAYGSLNQFHYGPSSVSAAEVQPIHQSSGIAPPLYATAAAFVASANPFYPNLPPAGFFAPQYSMGVYNFNSAVLPSYLAGYPHQGALPLAFGGASFPTSGVSNGGSVHAYDPQNLLKFNGQVGVPLHMQYIQPPVRGSYGSYGAIANQVNYRDPEKRAELVALSNNYTPQHLAGTSYNNLNIGRGNMSSHYYLGSPTNGGPSVHFPAVSPIVQSKPGGTRIPGGRYNMSLSPSSGGNPIQTNGQSQNWNNLTSLSFLEELKSGRGQRFQLSDIAGYIVEFSADQHGSRFIQQKLETCNFEEKASVFNEVVPHASKLITDVFGNYVVQKLFEYGSPDQRKYLASQLEGQILHLSFQMYGCRVIQKALEVIDLEQKARLVKELDGNIIKCVRDQNGNHVIQKCIESIPTDKIHFILSSFHGQVASLSMHPYGCRVIQRILERCNDDIQTQFIVDEILDAVCSLAQDQYGNYVTQHVLERGKPVERSKIVEKLAGSVVQLSQHKFASNVVEKCLEYSDSTTRGMLINEILGHGDKNDNLLIMMKDQYANYVIQKILEKCSIDQRAALLGLIRNHLPVLKKYTYGKHIVARFEQLYGEELGLGCDCSSPKIEQ